MQARENKQYVILNAALNYSSWHDQAVGIVYQASARLFNAKHKSARIIHIYDRPAFDRLGEEDQRAIQTADKILIAGHCYEDEYLRDSIGDSTIGVVYLAEFLATALNNLPEKPRQISIVACESLLFAENLSKEFASYPNLVMIPITARKFEIFVDPVTGRKFNNLPEGGRDRLMHHTKIDVVYKTRFFVDTAGSMSSNEIAGSITTSPRGVAEIMSDTICQMLNWTR